MPVLVCAVAPLACTASLASLIIFPCLRFCRVAIQEAERWNVLLSEMRRGLSELDLGLKGDLTMTEPMASDFTELQAAWPLVTSLATGHMSAACKRVPCHAGPDAHASPPLGCRSS